MTGDEGLLTLTIGMRVSPEPEVVDLLKQYRNALNHAIEWIVKLIENGYRRMKCLNCGFEEDRDVIAVLNLEKKDLEKMEGALIPLTAPQMTNVEPNRRGEPVNHPLRRGGGQT